MAGGVASEPKLVQSSYPEQVRGLRTSRGLGRSLPNHGPRIGIPRPTAAGERADPSMFLAG